MPDIIKGDAVSLGDYSSGKFDLMGWLGKHGKEVTRPEIDKVIEHLKGQGVQKFAAIGYCFGESVRGFQSSSEERFEGKRSLPSSREDSPRKKRPSPSLTSSTLGTLLAGGRYTVDLVVDGAASVGVVAHPSLLETPKDIEDLNKSSGHFLWLNAGEDGMFNKEKQNQAREILKGNDKHKMVGESRDVARTFFAPRVHACFFRSLRRDDGELIRIHAFEYRLRGCQSRVCDPRRPEGRARPQVGRRRVRAIGQVYQGPSLETS
jgi:dienelactone hydrolase